MALIQPFQASLVDNNGATSITTNATADALIITDSSNYSTNTTAGHIPPYFHEFRRIIIEHYKGTILNLSSLGDGDVVIPTASTGQNVITQPVTTGDGRYTVTLKTVPSYRSFITYDVGVCVYLPSTKSFYVAIVSGTGNSPDVSPSFWTLIPEASLPSAYTTTLFVVIDAALLTCMNTAVNHAVSVMSHDVCDDDALFHDRCFMGAAKLIMLFYGIQIDVQNQDTDAVDMKFDLVTKICCPC